MEAVIILPNQLYKEHPLLDDSKYIYLVEEDAYFTRYRFHKKKLILHRASMKAYSAQQKEYKIKYIENTPTKTLETLFEKLAHKKITKVQLTEILDHQLENKLAKLSEKHKINLNITGNPSFLTPKKWILEYFKNNNYRMTSFYISQRKRLNILLETGKPIGGKWSYDPENRGKLKKDIVIPDPWIPESDDYVDEATQYVEKRFPDNQGNPKSFNYPINWTQAEKTYADFLEKRLTKFGDYQDSISQEQRVLFHSLLSPSLNIGLITPDYVIKKALETNNVPLNSLEGFVRQVIGWREYMRAIYLIKGKEIGKGNYWNHQKSLPASYYTASTGILPLDKTLNKVNRTAYAHHIERLMIIGNISLLLGIDPNEIYRWFMEMFIDSYEWVMKANVYCMSQYSEGGLITTKPYISSSNYIRKMSDYPRDDWTDKWDSLFWAFINHHKEKIKENPRTRVIIYNLDRKTSKEMKQYNAIAKETIETIV